MNYFKGKNFFVEVADTTAKKGENYSIYLNIDTDYGFVDEAKVIINQQGGTNEKELRMRYITTERKMNIFACEIPLENVGIHYFCIRLVLNGKVVCIKNDVYQECASMTNNDMPYWTLTVYENNFEVPKWAKGKIMYQIFPDRFFKSENYKPELIPSRVTKEWGEMPNWKPGEDGEIHNNDYFMGNLKGIEEKLDYISGLGVEIIYLNPIFKSQSNHRYDTGDYEVVDPYLGTNDDLISLCDAAHKRGMKIVIDGVFNHTGNDSRYFNEYGTYNSIGAFKGPESPYYNWYRKNCKGGFEYWWGFKNLPVCDGYNAEWQNYVYGEDGLIDKWFAMGIDGLRLDVADELTDDFIENIRIAVKRNKKDGFLIGEVWDNAITKEGYGKQRTYLLGKGLDTVMNYPFTNAILKYVRYGRDRYFVETINEIITQYPTEALNSLMNSLSTHDITRAMSTLVSKGIQNSRYNWVWDVPYGREWQFSNLKISDEEYKKAREFMKLAVAIQYFLPGNPCIYYGDEVGMYGYRDPFNRLCFPWDNMDKDLHDFFVKIGKARGKVTFLADAKMKILEANEKILVFERYMEDETEDEVEFSKKKERRVIIAVNRTEEHIEIEMLKNIEDTRTIFEYNASDSILSEYGILIKTAK